jgi:hypothetical protein
VALTVREAVGLALLVACLTLAGWLYWKGGHDEKVGGENKALKSDAKATGKSNKISRETQGRVEQQGAETREQARRDAEALDEDARANSGDDAPADDDGMRVAQDAYDRAIRAACRVQRTSGCPDPAAAAQ